MLAPLLGQLAPMHGPIDKHHSLCDATTHHAKPRGRQHPVHNTRLVAPVPVPALRPVTSFDAGAMEFLNRLKQLRYPFTFPIAELLLAGGDIGYDAVAATAEVAAALAVVRDPAAASWRESALDAAKRHGFHEIVFRLENADVRTVDEPSAVADYDILSRVLDDVDALADWDALMATI